MVNVGQGIPLAQSEVHNINNFATPLLGPDYQSPRGQFPVSTTEVGMRARLEVMEMLASGDYQLQHKPCLCGSDRARTIAQVDRYRLPFPTVLCLRCALVRTDPRLDSQSTERFYATHYRAIYEREGHSMDGLYRIQSDLAKGRYDFVRRHMRSLENVQVLEIGCGGGWNLMPYLEAGCKVRGYDYDVAYLNEGRRRGLDVREGGLRSAIEAQESADLVVLSHVLEHFLDPFEELNQVRSLLSENGALFVEVPSLFAVRGRVMRAFQGVHAYTFVPQTLERLMAISGWERLALNPMIQSLWRPCQRSSVQHWPEDGKLVRRTEHFLVRWQESHPWLSRLRGAGERVRDFSARIGLVD